MQKFNLFPVTPAWCQCGIAFCSCADTAGDVLSLKKRYACFVAGVICQSIDNPANAAPHQKHPWLITQI